MHNICALPVVARLDQACFNVAAQNGLPVYSNSEALSSKHGCRRGSAAAQQLAVCQPSVRQFRAWRSFCMSSWISLRKDREFWTPVPPKTMRVPADQPWPFSPALMAPLCERLHITSSSVASKLHGDGPFVTGTSPTAHWVHGRWQDHIQMPNLPCATPSLATLDMLYELPPWWRSWQDC